MKRLLLQAAVVLVLSLVAAGLLTVDPNGSLSRRSILEFLAAVAVCVTILSVGLWVLGSGKPVPTSENEQDETVPGTSSGPSDADLRSAILEIADRATGASAQLYALFAIDSDEVPPEVSALDSNLERPTRIVEEAASLRPEMRTPLREFLDAQQVLYTSAINGAIPDTHSYKEKARKVLDRLGAHASPTDRPDHELVRRSLDLIKDLTGDPLLGVKISSGESTASFDDLRTETVAVTTNLEMASALTSAPELRAAADLITMAFFMQVEMHNFHTNAGRLPVTLAQAQTLRRPIEELSTSAVRQGLLDYLNS